MKTFFSILLGLLLLTGVSVESSSAQAAASTINVGVVNGKATRLPKPEYPDSLREAGIEGMVAVNVTIDETGTVIDARAEIVDQRARKSVDGMMFEPNVIDPQLRKAAENAALGAKFAPTLLNDVPVQITGKIVYNFSATQTSPQSGSGRNISGGVLNGKALTLPNPDYPPAARAVNAQGTVNVQVAIDEAGNVISATAVSGHPLLRLASETAAREAKFAPTLLDGTAVKVTGVLTYSFVM